MRVIALASLKGGCGKSTLAMNVADGLTRDGRVGVIDADPQGALRHWGGRARDPAMPTVQPGGDDPLPVIADAMARYRWVIVDCPPSLDMTITQRVLRAADVALIPVLPSPLDLWAGAATVEAVNAARRTNPGLKAGFVINQAEPASALSRALTKALSVLDVPTLTHVVRRRAAYRIAAVEASSVYRIGARGRDAACEIDALITEVREL